MVVSKQLNKLIFVEILALVFLIGVIVYAIFAISVSQRNNIVSQNGMVLVLDDTKFVSLEVLSDGEGFNIDGTTYTITNNNSSAKTYKVVVYPSNKDEDILKYVKVGSDDLYANYLLECEKVDNGYVIATTLLDPGYTKIHLFKYWYSLETPVELLDREDINLSFDYKIIIEE